jgi:hypothetical protein
VCYAKQGSKGMQSHWRDARVAPLDDLTEDGENYPVDDFRSL